MAGKRKVASSKSVEVPLSKTLANPDFSRQAGLSPCVFNTAIVAGMCV